MKGKFITFEGCEGCGKSTQVKFLTEYLEEHKFQHILTREPGGNPISEEIRRVILDTKNDGMSDECEALLYAAARVEHLKEKVIPALNEGKIVVCDRYIDSSFAYQGFARGLGDYVKKINSYALENCMPDCTIFINITPEEAFARKHGADKNDRIEQAGIEFHKRVYQGYLNVSKEYPDRFILIDGHGTKQETREKIISALKAKNII